jgi:hypothetical protein
MRLLGNAVVASAFALCLAAGPSTASELQIDLAVAMPASGSRRVVQSIPPGDATMQAVLRNQRGGETVRVDLRFDYRVPPGPVVFDEIIDRIEITVETADGEAFSVPTIIDPGEINLNPNRASLTYRATLYHPAERAGYVVRLRLFGNYE